MLTCNLISERYNILKKQQYGLKYCTDILYHLYIQQLGLNLGCSGVVLCYVPETCEDDSYDCSSLVISQNITYTCESTITITQL